MRFLVLISLIVGNLFAQSVAVREQQWRETLREIQISCMDESYEDIECKYEQNGSTLKRTPYVLERAIIGFGGVAVPKIGRFIKNTIWGSTLLIEPEQESYWQDHQIGKDYVRLKKSLNTKAKREKLRSCQKACLSTCVSSKIIQYSREFKNQFSTVEGKVESGKGDCKGFSAIADDINYALSIPSQVTSGSAYERTDRSLEFLGFHQQVMVEIDGKHYIMEPQSSSCRFYPIKFSDKIEPIETIRI